MPRIKRLTWLAFAVLLAMGATVAWASTYSVTHDAHVRGVILFIGDSNEVKAAAAIDHQFTARPDGYVPMMSARGGSSIRSSDCTISQQCDAPSSDYWKYRIADVLLRVVPDAIVVNFGINDAASPGRIDSTGYAKYGAKIDWLMQQIPGPIPVLWTNLPCAIEPLKYRTGCSAVNNALSQARGRWPKLVLVNWAAAAQFHPGFMDATLPGHYTALGYTAWTRLIVSTLNAITAP